MQAFVSRGLILQEFEPQLLLEYARAPGKPVYQNKRGILCFPVTSVVRGNSQVVANHSLSKAGEKSYDFFLIRRAFALIGRRLICKLVRMLSHFDLLSSGHFGYLRHTRIYPTIQLPERNDANNKAIACVRLERKVTVSWVRKRRWTFRRQNIVTNEPRLSWI